MPQTQAYGIAINAGVGDYLSIQNANLTGNTIGGIILAGALGGTHNVIANNRGYNPQGQAVITVGASPFTYTAGPSPEVIYVYGGTVSNITMGLAQIAAASPAQVTLPPNASLVMTYSVAPTMIKSVM